MAEAFKIRSVAGAFAAFIVLAVPASLVTAVPALSQTDAKSVVDAAKAKGVVGEQGDGLLGLVSGSADAATTAAVTEINTGRRKVYAATAAKSGVTPDAAGEATAQLLVKKLRPGEFYKPLGGSWMKK
ncbi:MAG TPA: YdbL family protein [Rhizomicrobium sp.]|nr:YdbL family protein [Rhizomicrobium sp.]